MMRPFELNRSTKEASVPTLSKGSIHDVFARTLLKEYGMKADHLPRVIEEIDKIYNSMSFAHSHIMMCLMGYQPSGRTAQLERYLEQHKTKEPKHKKEAREREERQRREQSFHTHRGSPYREPRYD